MSFRFLARMSLPPPKPSAHAAAPSPDDRDDEVPIPRFSHHTALVSCYGDAEVPPALRVSCLLSSHSGSCTHVLSELCLLELSLRMRGHAYTAVQEAQARILQ
jgi:hypothetical protein